MKSTPAAESRAPSTLRLGAFHSITTLFDHGPPPSADEVAAIVVAMAMQQSERETPPTDTKLSRFRMDGRAYEPHDRELP